MNITVYLASRSGNNPNYAKATRELGQWIAKKQHTLIFGGSYVGLMGLLADTVLENGGAVTGVTVDDIQEIKNVCHAHLTEMIHTPNMAARRTKMIELGDAFIALPGGPGTLDEISEVIGLFKLEQVIAPCIFYNVDGFYHRLKTFFDDMLIAGFVTKAQMACVHFIESADELDAIIGKRF